MEGEVTPELTGLDDLTSRLDRFESSLTAQEQRLAAHLVEHIDRWAYSSSSRMAGEVGVHRSTIVRFAQKLGFGGYPQLQQAARDAYLQTVAPPANLLLTEGGEGETFALQTVYDRELRNLQRSYNNLDLEALEVTARHLAQARRVLLFGRRFSYPLALHMSLVLRTMREAVDCAPSPGGMSVDQIFDLTPDDFVLVVSMRRHSAEVQRVLSHLAQAGVPTAVLTDASRGKDVPPGASMLRAHAGSPGVLDSYTALVSVSHALLNLVAGLLPNAKKRLAAAEAAWSRFNE